LKPDAIISAGTIKTFRMAVPVSEQAKKDGYFRVFSKVKGKMVWSDQYSFLQGALATDEDSITTLYTEAPMVDSVKPPAKIKFENEIKTKKVEKTVVVKQPISKKSEKSTDKNKEEKKTELAKTSKPEAPVSVTKSAPPTRNIDLSEFKKLRTIDEELIIYVIKDGDTLKSVAQKYYGAQSKERAIADLNFIDNPSSIKVGEEIIVDVKPLGKADKVKTAVRNSNISQVFAPEGKTTYTIKKGDTLGKIARQFYGRISDVSKLMKANPGLKPTNLRIGDVIIIPDRGDNA
jgi:nucleoid-associated protein YgaU